MPMYEYQCPSCGRTIEEIKNSSKKDETPKCVSCNVLTKRIMSAGIFKINGYNEANGYSKCNGV